MDDQIPDEPAHSDWEACINPKLKIDTAEILDQPLTLSDPC